MKTINKFITFLILILISATIQAQKQTPPEAGTPRDFKLPAKTQNKLDNGLKSTLVQYGVIPKVNISVIIKTGNIHEGPNEVWLADLTGNLMREGTTTMDFNAISKKVASMGGSVNISTGLNQMTFSGTVLSEYAPDLIKLLADIVINPAFPVTEIDRLKNDMKRDLTVQLASPQNQASEKFRSLIYKNQPYGISYPTQEMLGSYTIEMVKGFYEKNLGAKRSVVYVVGKFNEDEVTKAMTKAFSDWKEGPEVNYPIPNALTTNEIAIIDRPDSPQTTLIIGLPTIDPSNPDFTALQITNSILGGSFGSRITTNIREDKGYTYSPFSTINSGIKTAFWYEQADVTSEFTAASINEISKEIKRLQTEVLTKDEIQGIQNYEAGIFVLMNSTPGGIINQLNYIDRHELSDSYLSDHVKSIYSITSEKVQQTAKDYFKFENMTIVMVGDKKQIDKQIKANMEVSK